MAPKTKMTKQAAAVFRKAAKAMAPKSKALSAKVATLTKQVATLKKVSYDKRMTASAIANGDNLTTTYNSWNLSRMGTGTSFNIPIFGTSSTDLSEVNKAYLTSKDVFVSIRQNNEPNLTRCSMFLVSLKDQGATSSIFDPASRQLTIANTNDYILTNPSQCEQVLLNPKIFTVHAVKRFTMGYEGSAGPMADTYSQRRWKFTIKPKQPVIENPSGNIFNNSVFPSPMDPSQNYFVIIFNDNAIIDLEYPKVDINVYDHWSVPN